MKGIIISGEHFSHKIGKVIDKMMDQGYYLDQVASMMHLSKSTASHYRNARSTEKRGITIKLTPQFEDVLREMGFDIVIIKRMEKQYDKQTIDD